MAAMKEKTVDSKALATERNIDCLDSCRKHEAFQIQMRAIPRPRALALMADEVRQISLSTTRRTETYREFTNTKRKESHRPTPAREQGKAEYKSRNRKEDSGSTVVLPFSLEEQHRVLKMSPIPQPS
jgi:hypothetical protein